MKKNLVVSSEIIEQRIYLIRGQRVMLDGDLAMLYGVETKVLNQALKRNNDRFPEDFAFQLTKEEWNVLRSQIVTLNSKIESSLRCQFGTSKKEVSTARGEHRKYLPHVFTEHGVVMLANILRSKHAIKMSIEVVRTFIKMRKMLASSEKFNKELDQLKSFVLKHTQKSDQEFRKIWGAIEKLSMSPSQEEDRIGFKLS